MNLPQTFVLANAFKEGDLLVGGGDDARVREEARRTIESLAVASISSAAFVDDGVTDIIERSIDRPALAAIGAMTIGTLKHTLLSPGGPEWARIHRRGLRSEVIAAVVKIMSDGELSTVARRLFNPLPGDGIAIGSPQHFGSRIQPNSPGDDEDEILLSILEGLTYGCGDVIIGLNPASDDVDTIVQLEDLLRRVVDRLQLPTRYCVLSDIVKQTRARERVPVDVGFQSLAGTSKALGGMVGLDAGGILDLARGFTGCYFETGQGSAVTNGAAEGVDMVTLEARAYGVARHIQQTTGAWTIVNDVAGFIGPEVFRTAAQLHRACLEDVVMAKLHGLTMGLDVCATFHMGISPAELTDATARIVETAAPAYLMAVAGKADPMLGYLTTSFREHPQLRKLSKRSATTAMEQRLAGLGASSTTALYAAYAKAGGDRRDRDALQREAAAKIERMQHRGFDLGREGDGETRVDAIYAQARRALYAVLDASVLQDASPHHLAVRSLAHDRDDYLAHPPSGESIRREDADRVSSLGAAAAVQIVVSDGLNANAVNENLRSVLPPLRRELSSARIRVCDVDVVIQNGRVRAGYHAGSLIGGDAVIHLIGERPGTGLDTMSAYLTYGRDSGGRLRWSTQLDHSATTAVCGIHRRGKAPEDAVSEIVRLMRRIVDSRRSGVSL